MALGAEGPTQRLLFAARATGASTPWELFEVRDASVGPTKLVGYAFDARSIAVSPNGKRISYATSDGSLWVFERGGQASKLAAPFQTGRYGFPSWIDDDTLAYSIYFVTPPTEDSDIYAYSFVERRQRRLVAQTGSQDFVSASPNGDRIAYMSSVTTQLAGFGAAITQQLWVASLRTGAVQQLTNGGARDASPAWSPDGLQIAFSSDRAGGPHIWTIDVGTKALNQLTVGSGVETSPSWSPDGRQILFASAAGGRSELHVIDVATRKISVLKPFGNRDVEIRDPVWVR